MKSIVLPIYLFSLVCSLIISAGGTYAKDEKMVASSILVNAPPKIVYETIRQYRNNAAARRKQLSTTSDGATVKENMKGVAVLGDVECIWQEKDTPYHQIDYRLVKSDKFRSAFGTWHISPANDGRSTQLQLEAYVDAFINIPFKAQITRSNTTKDVNGRLQTIKQLAEATTVKRMALQPSGANTAKIK